MIIAAYTFLTPKARLLAASSELDDSGCRFRLLGDGVYHPVMFAIEDDLSDPKQET